MTLAVDARWMVGSYRGMGKYARSLLDPVKESAVAMLPLGAAPSDMREIRSGKGFFPYWEQAVLPRLCVEHNVTQLLCPYNTAPLQLPPHCRLILVVHDLIYLESWKALPPSISAYQTLGRVYRRAVVPKVIREASRLITVSNYTRSQIIDRFGQNPDDVLVIPNSIGDDWFSKAPIPRSERRPYVLTVAGEAPSKNLPRLIAAFATFLKNAPPDCSELTLRIVGIKQAHHHVFRRLAAKAGVGGRVLFEGFLSNEALQALYKEARLFVMASLYEGFGIPLLEAMASGTPVACSNTTSLPEVAGPAGWQFDPRDVEDMARVLTTACCSSDEFDERARQGLQRADRYRFANISPLIGNFWRSVQ